MKRARDTRRRSAEDVAWLSNPAETDQPRAVEHKTHLVIGRIVAARGVRGELKVEISTDDPERFFRLREVYLGDALAPFTVKKARLFQGCALLTLHGIEDRTTAESWRGMYVHVKAEDAIPLAEGEYYHYQIIGLLAITTEGEKLGRVTEVLATGANDVYVVQGAQGEILLPAIRDVILNIDLKTGSLLVRLPDGLLE